jgi:RNA polymerase sigma-70 factor (ECF subfamily)
VSYGVTMALDTEELTDAVPRLYGYALSLSRNHDVAEDLVQDTMLRALQQAGTFRGDSSLQTWLHRILHHRYVDTVRASSAISTSPEDVASLLEQRWQDDSYTVDAEQVALLAERDDELRDALAHLPVTYRSAVILHDVEDWTAAGIAEIHEVSLAAAKQRIRRGRMMLVDELAAHAQRHADLKGVPMRCWAAREKVSDYLDGDLTPPERNALELHLGGCPTCPPLYAGLVGVRNGLERLRDPDTVIAPALAERLRSLRTGV